MALEIVTRPMMIASAVCFILGSFGYILFRLWISPILRYRKTKKSILSDLAAAGDNAAAKARLRQHSAALTSVYHEALPYWYRLLLEKRREDPIQAASILMKLSNTKDKTHASRQSEEILTCLNLAILRS